MIERITYEVKVQTVAFNQWVLTDILGDLYRNYIPFIIQSLHFRGSYSGFQNYWHP